MFDEARFECPECGKLLNSGTQTCPGCNVSLIRCERHGNYVAKADYKENVSMCEICWANTIK